MRSMGIRRALTMVAVSAFALGAVGVAEAGKGKRVKTRLAKTEIGPDGASGVVKSKNRACMKGRSVTLRGPKPFNPRAVRGVNASGEMVKIGTFRTSRNGRWRFSPSRDGFFIAGVYEIRVPSRRVTVQGKRFFCLAARLTTKA